ncbi:aldo/keto reductase [Serratia fonticola]|uniref:aldo/keto reductase n=1 Tax=Serratia fonticola TaxID=47917 RepID=UPI00126874F8
MPQVIAGNPTRLKEAKSRLANDLRLLSRPAVTFPIIGVTSVEQLTDNIRSVEIALEEHEISALEEFYTPHSTAELE